jgi:hypothetical protein
MEDGKSSLLREGKAPPTSRTNSTRSEVPRRDTEGHTPGREPEKAVTSHAKEVLSQDPEPKDPDLDETLEQLKALYQQNKTYSAGLYELIISPLNLAQA